MQVRQLLAQLLSKQLLQQPVQKVKKAAWCALLSSMYCLRSCSSTLTEWPTFSEQNQVREYQVKRVFPSARKENEDSVPSGVITGTSKQRQPGTVTNQYIVDADHVSYVQSLSNIVSLINNASDCWPLLTQTHSRQNDESPGAPSVCNDLC